MTTKSDCRPEAPRFSERQRVLAARIRVKVDQRLGYATPEWIVELAKRPVA